MDKSYLVKLFVDHFQGAACVRALDEDLVLYANDAYMEMAHHARSFSQTLQCAKTRNEQSEIIFCEYVESHFKKTRQPIFAGEWFSSRFYSTVRVLISFYGGPAILTLVQECGTVLPLSMVNDLHTCNVVQYLDAEIVLNGPVLQTQDSNALVDTFVRNFLGLCFIRDLESDEIDCTNEAYYEFTRGADSLALLQETLDDEGYKQGLAYCDYIERVFRQSNQPIFAFEEVGGKRYVSFRFLIDYFSQPKIMTAILPTKGLLEQEYDVFQCYVNHKIGAM